MKTRNRTVLALALGTVLVAPLASAQSDTGRANANARAGLQQTVEPDQALPPPVNPDELMDRRVDPRVPAADVVGAAPPPPPVQARGAAQAAGHADVVQRDVWTRLDADGDGRISVEEGAVDADFDTDFEAMDADGDGFVSDAEFRAQARAEHRAETGGDRAAFHSAASQRSLWTELDADGDGRISLDEGSVDADFGANFEMMDGDDDGFVTDAEFRANARLDADGTDEADDRDVDRVDHTDVVEPDPMDDRDGMDDDGTGMDGDDGE